MSAHGFSRKLKKFKCFSCPIACDVNYSRFLENVIVKQVYRNILAFKNDNKNLIFPKLKGREFIETLR